VRRHRWSDAEWREALERLLRERPPADRANDDPVFFPRRAMELGRSRIEIEHMALLSAMLAYGRVAVFLAVLRTLAEESDYRLSALLRDPTDGRRWPAYRLSRGDDIAAVVRAAVSVTERRGGLWESFRPGWETDETVRAGVAALRGDLLRAIPSRRRTRGVLHLLPGVENGQCAKRWMLFLRWMVRRDDVDLGLWSGVPPRALVIPLDRHIGFLGRAFGWTRRRTDDARTAEEITAVLRRFDPADPLRYDFALCHLGISGLCRHARGGRCPPECAFRGVCRRCAGRGRAAVTGPRTSPARGFAE